MTAVCDHSDLVKDCNGNLENSTELSELKKMLGTSEFLQEHDFDHEFIKMSLEMFSHDLEKIVICLKKWSNTLGNLPELYNHDPPYKKIYRSKVSRILKSRRVDGGRIMVNCSGKMKFEGFDDIDYLVTMVWAACGQLIEEKRLKNDFHAVATLSDFKVVQRYSWRGIKMCREILKLAYPEITPKSHIICPGGVSLFFAKNILRIFMPKEKLGDTLLYGRDLSKIYEHIPRESLPEDFGGTLTDEYTEEEFEKFVLTGKKFFQKLARSLRLS